MASRSKSPRGRRAVSAATAPFYESYLSANPSKAAAEKFNVVFSAVWIAVFGTIVSTQVYKKFGDLEYMLIGLFVALPYFVWPIWFPFDADAKLPWNQRYFVTSNVWIAVLSYVGNYFWTHYFYTVLGAGFFFFFLFIYFFFPSLSYSLLSQRILSRSP